MLTELKAALCGLMALALLLAGFLLGKMAYESRTLGVMAVHSQQRQADGSLIAARTMSTPATAPAQMIPVGERLTATAQIQVAARVPQPRAGGGSTAPLIKSCQQLLTCPALQIDESLVKDGKGQPDLVVSGPGVAQARFTPLPEGLDVSESPWAAGLSYDSSHELGAFVDRDLGRLRLGLEINQRRDSASYQGNGVEGRVRLGWRF